MGRFRDRCNLFGEATRRWFAGGEVCEGMNADGFCDYAMHCNGMRRERMLERVVDGSS